jgi:hypothetical protein
MLLDSMNGWLYLAFAGAAFLLLYRWWYAGQLLDKPCWALYLFHLPFASLVWSLQLWDCARWVSVLGNLGLICCAFEAARACGWWIIPQLERRWVLVSSWGVGLWMAGVIASVIYLPLDQPWFYYLIKACAPACAIGIIVSAWAYQRIAMDRGANNSRNAWHAWLLVGYCLLGVLNAVEYSAPSDPAWAFKTYVTMTLKVALFICWWFKVCPIPHRRVLPA